MLENNEIGQLEQISNLMNTQDNRITSDPLFLVEELVRDYGYEEEWCHGYVWMEADGEDNEPTDETLEILESHNPFRTEKSTQEFYTISNDWYKLYYKERWEFVTVFFTEKACLEYIERNKHRGEMRSYAMPAYDNPELKLVRRMLLARGKNEHINN